MLNQPPATRRYQRGVGAGRVKGGGGEGSMGEGGGVGRAGGSVCLPASLCATDTDSPGVISFYWP